MFESFPFYSQKNIYIDFTICSFFSTQFSISLYFQSSDDPTEMADRHVYANPTYLSHFEANSANPNWAQTASNNAATMQIGGLPFYLPKDASEPTRENIPDLGK